MKIGRTHILWCSRNVEKALKLVEILTEEQMNSLLSGKSHIRKNPAKKRGWNDAKDDTKGT